MAYKALYRQFRPRRFDEISGQTAIVSVLKNQVKTGNPAHAYVFAGQRGTGKTTAARILAMALNCKNPHDGEPCLECENCLDALNDNMIDIVEIDAASNNGVDSARDIREKVNLLPVAGKHKIYIIDEAHMLSTSAFNALLKTLEEPPEYAVFIFATTELRKLPVTVLSRCQRFDFKSLTEKEIIERLKLVCTEIGRDADEDALREIARASGGAMRDALTILETCTAKEGRIDIENVSKALNLASRDILQKLVSAMDRFDAKTALDTLNVAFDAGVLPSELVNQLLQYHRDKLINGFIDGSIQKEDAKEYIRRMDILTDAEDKLKNSGRGMLTAEIAVMKILLPGSEEADNDARILKLERQVEQLSRMKLVPAEAAIQTVKENKGKTEEKKTETVTDLDVNAEELWEKIKETVKEDEPMLYPLIKTVYATSLEGSKITLASVHGSVLKNLLAGVEQMKLLTECAEKASGRRIIIEIDDSDSEETFDEELPRNEMPLENEKDLM